MADTQSGNVDSAIEFKVTIDKKSPAIPGDKYISKVLYLDKAIPDEFKFWNQQDFRKEFSVWLKSKKLGKTKIVLEDEKLNWDGKTLVTIIDPLYDYDIVPYAGLVNPPRWHVKIMIFADGDQLISNAKVAASNTVTKSPTPASTAVNPTTSLLFLNEISIVNAEVKEQETEEEKSQEELKHDGGKQSEPNTRNRIRIDAFLSFDKEWEYTVLPLRKWPNEMMDNRKPEYFNDIYQAIIKDDEQKVSRLIQQKIITCEVKRLTLNELTEGEWLLPIYPIKENKDYLRGIDIKERLTYLKVAIEWASGGVQTPPQADQSATKKTG